VREPVRPRRMRRVASCPCQGGRRWGLDQSSPGVSMASTRISEDPRIDPRIKAMLAELNPAVAADDATSREQVLEEASTEGAVAQRTMVAASLGMSDTEEIAPSNGLTVTDHGVVSDPDGNKIRIRLIRPDGHDVVVDFRNALAPSSVDEVAPYPAGLNDCVSGVRWVVATPTSWVVDATRVVIAGESGGAP